MELQKIIDELSVYNKKFPREALREASKNKEQVTEYLLAYFEKLNKEKPEIAAEDMLHLYGLFLLAEFREKKAFPLIVEFCKRESLDADIGDVLTESMDQILYSTYDGNKELLKSLIECETADDFIRTGTLSVLAAIMLEESERESLCEYVKTLIDRVLDREEQEDYVYTTYLAGVVCNFKLYELLPLVQKLYDYDLIDERVHGRYDGFIDCLYGHKMKNITATGTAIEEMQNWASFDSESPKTDRDMEWEKLIGKMSKQETRHVNKIGRNDPCPCGSGKKYKKCCMRLEEEKMKDPMQADRQKWLKEYPLFPEKDRINDGTTVFLDDYYDEEYLEIDKLAYLALSRRAIPIWKDPEVSNQERKLYYLKRAYTLLKEKMEKENMNSFEEYDLAGKIHYRSCQWMETYVSALEEEKMSCGEERAFVKKYKK